MTLSELFDKWHEERCKTVSEITSKVYRSYLDKYIPDSLKNCPVNDIDPDDWTGLKQAMLDGNAPNGIHVPRSTARAALGIFHSVFIYGKRQFGLNNPANGAQIDYKNMRSVTVFTKSEIKKMRKAIKPYDISNLCIMLCLYTGVELNEICAVRWKNIDTENKLLMIRGVVDRINKRGKMIKDNLTVVTPKNKKTIRDLPIPTWIAEQLEVMKPMHDDDEFLLAGEDGTVLPMTFRGQYTTFLKNAGVQKKGIIALRHTFAMTCVNKNVEVGTLSEMLGHSRVSETIRQYYVIQIKDKREIVEGLYD